MRPNRANQAGLVNEDFPMHRPAFRIKRTRHFIISSILYIYTVSARLLVVAKRMCVRVIGPCG